MTSTWSSGTTPGPRSSPSRRPRSRTSPAAATRRPSPDRTTPDGIPIRDEAKLEELIAEGVDEVIFSYSDVSHETVMHLASRALAAGADFRLLGPARTMLEAKVPVIAVCAVRTGSGKSQTTRKAAMLLRESGRRTVVVRHPMPYGDLEKQAVQRFAELEDLDRHDCTIEEREEYEPHIVHGTTVYAGVDYGAILEQAQQEADVILWDGGNNDLPFYRPKLEIVVVDPHRAGHECSFHPGEANLRRAEVVIINKVGTAPPGGIEAVRASIAELNPGARVIEAKSPPRFEEPVDLKGKRVLAIEDGPTLTHGGMTYGAGVLAAKEAGAELVDAREHAVGKLRDTFESYPRIGTLLPAMGYGQEQIRDLEATVAAVPCDAVVIGTPIDLRKLIKFGVPAHRVRYDLEEQGDVGLREVLEEALGG